MAEWTIFETQKLDQFVAFTNAKSLRFELSYFIKKLNKLDYVDELI